MRGFTCNYITVQGSRRYSQPSFCSPSNTPCPPPPPFSREYNTDKEHRTKQNGKTNRMCSGFLEIREGCYPPVTSDLVGLFLKPSQLWNVFQPVYRIMAVTIFSVEDFRCVLLTARYPIRAFQYGICNVLVIDGTISLL